MNSLDLAQRMIRCASITCEPNRLITEMLEEELSKLGFEVGLFQYIDPAGVTKFGLEARRQPFAAAAGPDGKRGVAFFGHTDVVPVDGWDCKFGGPFDAAVADGKLWGRGACDMKGPVAAALTAMASIDRQEQQAALYFFLTGDEESGMHGAAHLADESAYFKELVAQESVGVIGEPTELQLVNSHKGGCHIDFVAHGVAAHSSTHDGKNANWQMIPFLQYLQELNVRMKQDPNLQSSLFDPPDMTLNLILKNQPCAGNITVAESLCSIFFRPMPDTPWEDLLNEIVQRAAEAGLECHRRPNLLPLHTSATRSSITETLRLLDQPQPKTVCFATDGSFFQALQDTFVLGPGSIEQAHRPDEFIDLGQLAEGTALFERIFRHFACS